MNLVEVNLTRSDSYERFYEYFYDDECLLLLLNVIKCHKMNSLEKYYE